MRLDGISTNRQQVRTGPVDRVDATTPAGGAPRNAAPAVSLSPQVQDMALPPVDAERVAAIRESIEKGTYPLIPTKIADAIIAASFQLRIAK